MREAQVDTVCGALDEVLAGTRAGSALRRAAS